MFFSQVSTLGAVVLASSAAAGSAIYKVPNYVQYAIYKVPNSSKSTISPKYKLGLLLMDFCVIFFRHIASGL